MYSQFQYVLSRLMYGVMWTVSSIVNLLVHFGGYRTILTAVLLALFVWHIIGNRAPGSDRALPPGQRKQIGDGK